MLRKEFNILVSAPTSIYADNNNAIRVVANPEFHDWTKRIEAYRIKIPRVPAELQIADLFTKAMICNRYNFLISKLMLRDYTHEFEGKCEERTKPGIPKELDILNLSPS